MSFTPACSARWPTSLRACCPPLDRPRVLELGCGTGLFSRHLVERYPEGSFVLTDVAPAMIAQCRRNLAPTGKRPHQLRGDGCGRRPAVDGRSRPHRLEHDAALARRPGRRASTRLSRFLAPGGVLALRDARQGELRRVARRARRARSAERACRYLALPGVVEEERWCPTRTRSSFLRRIKAIGGLTPKEGYAPLSPGALRRAIRATDAGTAAASPGTSSTARSGRPRRAGRAPR